MNWVLFLKEYLFIFQKTFYHRCYGETVLDYTSFQRHVMIFFIFFQCFLGMKIFNNDFHENGYITYWNILALAFLMRTFLFSGSEVYKPWLCITAYFKCKYKALSD